MIRTPSQRHVGIASVLRRCAVVLCCVGAIVAFTHARASSANHLWFEFERRCLAPFEDFKPAIVADLKQKPSASADVRNYAVLRNGLDVATLSLNMSPDAGERSCQVTGQGLTKGFEGWKDIAVETRRYVATEASQTWLSHEWIEPVIMIEKLDGAVRVTETRLES